ncbi:hypothetical protein QBC44DRAFT_306583 [Cladorrhinum sp. PSN332]|nr:hypothetical protein QBC44DRAFT_306583 [Cladorrhinum sp. PSN332]
MDKGTENKQNHECNNEGCDRAFESLAGLAIHRRHCAGYSVEDRTFRYRDLERTYTIPCKFHEQGCVRRFERQGAAEDHSPLCEFNPRASASSQPSQLEPITSTMAHTGVGTTTPTSALNPPSSPGIPLPSLQDSLLSRPDMLKFDCTVPDCSYKFPTQETLAYHLEVFHSELGGAGYS